MGNAIYRKGSGTFQTWINYPNSPIPNETHPYQCIVRKLDDSEAKLYASPTKHYSAPFSIGDDSGEYLGTGGGKIYSLVSGEWVFVEDYPTGSYGTQIFLADITGTIREFHEANNNVDVGLS